MNNEMKRNDMKLNEMDINNHTNKILILYI